MTKKQKNVLGEDLNEFLNWCKEAGNDLITPQIKRW